MMTVNQLAKKCGVSVRTLHHYDAIGLLKPAQVTEAGYRLYDEAALERLYFILLFRELGFRLKDIRGILDAPDFDRNRVLDRQIELLERKQRHLKSVTEMARRIKQMGVKYMEFKEFDVKKMDDYAEQAKTLYGKTDAYKEYTQKAKGRTKQQSDAVNGQLMDFFVRLGQLRGQSPDSAQIQHWVAELQAFFTANFYTCTPEILLSLGQMYADGGAMTENIDAAGGDGTGRLAREAIACYCKEQAQNASV